MSTPFAHRHHQRASLLALGAFLLSIVLLSTIFSGVAFLCVDLTWWQVFRRCVSIAAALSVWFLLRLQQRTVRSYGLSLTMTDRRDFLFGVWLGIGSLVVLLGVNIVRGWAVVDVNHNPVKFWRTVVGFLPLAVVVGVLEELVFRGVFLQHLLVVSRRLALIVSSAAYALVHLRNPSITVQTVEELVGLFLLGMILSDSYLRTGRLALAVGLHAIFAYGAQVNKLFVMFPDYSITWLSGTGRLVNGLVGWMVLGITWALMVWWVEKTRTPSAA